MTIAKNKMVSVTYELKTDPKGEIIEKAVSETPLTFLCGAGQMLKKFEENLMGLKKGEHFDFKLETSDAYGEAQENAVIDLPRNVFEVNGKFDDEMIKEGNVVPMQDSSGRKLSGIILEVAEAHIKVDFNHPLSGDDLYFKGEVLEVRDATEEEIKAVQEPQGGCCDGGSCGSGCSC